MDQGGILTLINCSKIVNMMRYRVLSEFSHLGDIYDIKIRSRSKEEERKSGKYGIPLILTRKMYDIGNQKYFVTVFLCKIIKMV